MTRAQLEEIRACVEGEELVGRVFHTVLENGRECRCFVGKLVACFYPELDAMHDWPSGALLLDARLGIAVANIYSINDRAGPDSTSPSPLRAPAVLAYLETLVED